MLLNDLKSFQCGEQFISNKIDDEANLSHNDNDINADNVTKSWVDN